jgi:hypothetical protein
LFCHVIIIKISMDLLYWLSIDLFIITFIIIKSVLSDRELQTSPELFVLVSILFRP